MPIRAGAGEEQRKGRTLMAISSKDLRPSNGPDSFHDRDRALLSGFVVPGIDLPHGERKVAVAHLQARIIAVGTWVATGNRLSHKELADLVGVSGRCLSNYFPIQSALYAFPPPELARSLCGASVDAWAWDEIARLVRPVFSALELNPQARELMSGLVVLHRRHTELTETDGHFSTALRNELETKRDRNTRPITGLFADGMRLAFEDWFDDGEPSLEFVANRVELLLVGPISSAFDALRESAEDEGPYRVRRAPKTRRAPLTSTSGVVEIPLDRGGIQKAGMPYPEGAPKVR